MKTLKQLSILTSLAAVSLLTGCDIAEETCATDADCDTAAGEVCANIDATTLEGTCEAPADGSGSGSGEGSAAVTCDTDPTICTAEQQCDDKVCVGFQYIAIVSRGTETSGEKNTPGPDIDAIAIVRGGVPQFAAEYKQFVAGDETTQGNVNSDPSKLLGPNDAMGDAAGGFCDLDGTGTPDSTFNGNPYNEPDGSNDDVPTFCSLGFDGGFVVVKMPSVLQKDDRINVYELGKNWCSNIGSVRADEFELYVGPSNLTIDASTTLADIESKFVLLGGKSEANGGLKDEVFNIN